MRSKLLVYFLIIDFFVLNLFLQSCSHIKTVNAKNSTISFGKIFALKDSIIFQKQDSIKSIMTMCLDRNSNIIICDYAGEKIVRYNQKFKKINYLNDSINGKKILKSPISCTTDEVGNIFISSNGNRRILIYDPNEVLKKTFIISGGNITPVSLAVTGNKIYMGGFNLEKRTLIHQYSLDGEYLNDFLHQSPAVIHTKFGRTINYPFFDICGKTLWIVQTLDYNLSQYSFDGKELQQFQFKPAYHVDISSSVIENATFKNLVQLENNFSRQIILLSNGEQFFVQVQMPQTHIDPVDYLRGSDFRLDEFNSEGKNILCGINCHNNRLLYIDKKKNEFYFLSKSDFKDGVFTIKIYKFLK